MLHFLKQDFRFYDVDLFLFEIIVSNFHAYKNGVQQHKLDKKIQNFQFIIELFNF